MVAACAVGRPRRAPGPRTHGACRRAALRGNRRGRADRLRQARRGVRPRQARRGRQRCQRGRSARRRGRPGRRVARRSRGAARCARGGGSRRSAEDDSPSGSRVGVPALGRAGAARVGGRVRTPRCVGAAHQPSGLGCAAARAHGLDRRARSDECRGRRRTLRRGDAPGAPLRRALQIRARGSCGGGAGTIGAEARGRTPRGTGAGGRRLVALGFAHSIRGACRRALREARRRRARNRRRPRAARRRSRARPSARACSRATALARPGGCCSTGTRSCGTRGRFAGGRRAVPGRRRRPRLPAWPECSRSWPGDRGRAGGAGAAGGTARPLR